MPLGCFLCLFCPRGWPDEERRGVAVCHSGQTIVQMGLVSSEIDLDATRENSCCPLRRRRRARSPRRRRRRRRRLSVYLSIQLSLSLSLSIHIHIYIYIHITYQLEPHTEPRAPTRTPDDQLFRQMEDELGSISDATLLKISGWGRGVLFHRLSLSGSTPFIYIYIYIYMYTHVVCYLAAISIIHI